MTNSEYQCRRVWVRLWAISGQLAAFAMMVENSFAASAADMAGVLQ
jgi:hypothetical protein